VDVEVSLLRVSRGVGRGRWCTLAPRYPTPPALQQVALTRKGFLKWVSKVSHKAYAAHVEWTKHGFED